MKPCVFCNQEVVFKQVMRGNGYYWTIFCGCYGSGGHAFSLNLNRCIDLHLRRQGDYEKARFTPSQNNNQIRLDSSSMDDLGTQTEINRCPIPFEVRSGGEIVFNQRV